MTGILKFPANPPALVGIKPSAEPPWTSVVDMLKTLIRDIESGTIPTPRVAYVAMQSVHPTNDALVNYPSYLFFPKDMFSGLAVAGLLAKHQAKVS